MVSVNNESPSSVLDEISEAKKLYPSVNFLTSTSSFLIATYERSPYTRIKMTITFPDHYPSQHLVVTIDQDNVVPPGLKKKLEKEMNNLAMDIAKQSTQYNQIEPVLKHLVSFIDGNMFVPCWKELKKSVDLIQKIEQSTIQIISESKGKIRLCLNNQQYYYKCTITIDPAYPDFSAATGGKACLLQIQSTNFPSSIEKMLTSQAQEIVRKMQEGLSQVRALQLSNPIKVPKHFHANTDDFKAKKGISNETLQSIKHDTEALKLVGEIRKKEQASAAPSAKADNGYVDRKHLAKDRKDARRTIQKITDAELANDHLAEEKEKAWKEEEAKRLSGFYDVHIDTNGTINPQPSLFVLIHFLVERIKSMCTNNCPCCHERVLPDNPADLQLMYGSTSNTKDKQASKAMKKRKPMRTYCGCWYHKSCLNTLLTEPPFGIECPTENCGRRVFHPDWPGDIKQLERDWAAKAARLREMEDAMLFL